MPELKFCGLTRPEDAAEADRLGAGYVGVIFAGGPRNLSEEQARHVLGGQKAAKRVGVFPSPSSEEVERAASALSLDVVQIHSDASVTDLERLREQVGAEIWSVLRISGSDLPLGADDLFAASDAVVLDTRVEGMLGGSGAKFDWANVARKIERMRRDTRVVLAGGLTPDNVVDAIAVVAPDVVDVSSGVESSPGVKNHKLMARFASAVRGNTRLQQ